MEKKETRKLTLCDGCILMLIFGVAASVFTPGVTQAVEQKKLSDLVDRLYTMRSQIQLYKTHHNGLLPGQQACGDPVTSEAFAASLKQNRPDGPGCYLKNVLDNPYASGPDGQNTITCVNDPNAVPFGTEQTAWWFNAATGDFFACDSQYHTKY